MFSYGRSNFTWNGTLRELQTSLPASCKERARPIMAASASSSGVEVLLSNLQNLGDIESTLNILNVLDELLSAGTDRRIHYMISKGGSEALLTAMVKSARSFNPNYTLLLPLLHLLAKVGHRDRRIGVKAQNADAVRLTLSLLRQNSKHPRRAAACLWVLQVYCSSVSTANLLGECRAIDVIYRFICPYTTKTLHTIKAAIDALAALLCTKANVHSAVSKGYVSGLLRLYEDWSSKDTEHIAITIRCALLRCLHEVTNSTAGRHALVAHGGIGLLYDVTQTCLFTKGLESLVDPSVQLMRKCYPKSPLSLKSDLSVYCLELPRQPGSIPVLEPELNSEEDSEEEEDDEEDDSNESEEADSKDFDDDLETDVNKLRTRPAPDRPPELLAQYSCLRPELIYEFQELDSSSSEPEESSSSSDEEVQSSAEDASRLKPSDFNSCPTFRTKGRDARGNHREQREEEGAEEAQRCRTVVDTLAERHIGAGIPHHDRRLYRAAAVLAKSIPGFNILAFPDFWGHLPLPGNEPMAPRKPKVQRQKVFEDIQRLLNPDDVINEVVFDLEDPSPHCSSERSNSLKFFSKFECGNLRKATQVRRNEYDLILNADANCSQHTQWFYFEVSNMVANVPYRFNVINCEKTNSQFNYGMQPVLYSVREALEGRPHWKRTGTEICYYRNHFCAARGKKRSTFYTLTFTVTFRHNDDVCYLAYHYPYTYSALQSHLMVLHRSVDPSKVFFRQQVLCQTLSGNPCPLVTITACPATRGMRDLHQFRSRPCIVLTARVHPGESNASWVMKGTLEFLCSDDPVAQSLREAFVFKIIPMLNPDGVINGTHRCSLSGEDLNRQWCKPDPVLSPTIYHAKGFLYYLSSTGSTPLVFCDYHGHSRKKNVFLYGCSIKETLWQSGSDTVGLKEDPGYRTIPKTLDRLAPAFSFNSCNYQVEKSRSATARVVVWREIGVLRSYTMESTYNGCDQGIYKGLQTGTRELQDMGVKFCHSLLSVRRNVPSLYSSRRLVDHIDLDHNSHNCFEDDEPPCVEEIEYSTDGLSKLKGSDLDSDINGNTSSADEQEEEEEVVVHKGFNPIRRCEGQSHQSSLRSRLFPHLIGHDLEVIEVLHMKRNSCNGVGITGRQYLS